MRAQLFAAAAAGEVDSIERLAAAGADLSWKNQAEVSVAAPRRLPASTCAAGGERCAIACACAGRGKRTPRRGTGPSPRRCEGAGPARGGCQPAGRCAPTLFSSQRSWIVMRDGGPRPRAGRLHTRHGSRSGRRRRNPRLPVGSTNKTDCDPCQGSRRRRAVLPALLTLRRTAPPSFR